MTELTIDRHRARHVARHEAWPKLLGTARYTADEPHAGLLHAVLVPAPVARGRVVAIDTGGASSLPGVVLVLTHENTPELRDAGVQRLLHGPQIHHLGQPVAMVVADSPAAARAAASRVRVEVHAETPIADLAQAGDALVAPATVGRHPTDTARGDADAALAGAEVRLDRRYRTSANVHLPMEPHVSTAVWERDADGEPSLHLYSSTQAVFATRRTMAHTLGLRRERVRVTCRLIGGGFGSKGPLWWPHTALVAQAARMLDRPVRLELTRAEMFALVGRRSPTSQRLRFGASNDGALQAIVHEATLETSPFGEYCDATCAASRWLYACANVRTAHRVARVNATQPNPMRAPGEGPGLFALESALDELAGVLRIDPLDLRLRNIPDRDPHLDLPWSSHSLRECLLVAAQAFGWRTRAAAGTVRDGRWRIGCGMASAAYPVHRQPSEAEVACTAPGRFRVRCGMQDMGSGSFTALARIVGDIVGCADADVDVEIGDTQLPEGPYSGGSMATASFVPAVAAAARALKVRLDGGECPADGAPVVEHARAEPETSPTTSTYAMGAVFAEVRVDVLTGEVRVSRITAAYAAGRIVDAAMVRSQYLGGLVGGIGMALHEASVVDPTTGRIVNDDLAGYLVPVHADMPVFDIHLVDEYDRAIGEGVKGVGMLGTCGTAAAIANAVAAATGVRVRSLPIRLDDLLTDADVRPPSGEPPRAHR